jgi:hypothetical protein
MKKVKLKRKPVWSGVCATTVRKGGCESQKGYGAARRRWDQETWREREARLTGGVIVGG